ncbi:Hsp70 family protein [Noviherbaspirillum sp. Root189]|uniref:Hsp70 family protein n=1 Tax=Noviherbaspirillum sp. Root189 TaxID=1736487 RepID=UPI0007110CC0|nr:Hsp70 family protein [Noviherbaspirillum sp. Root189]KRB67844.1 molecular chaperone DnaK [Noviherbaspirillum sp. Root189]
MKRFSVGIDLGTTNTVVAYAESGSDEIRIFDMEQLVGPGEIKALPFLPSLRFHAARGELPAGAVALPWTEAKPAAEQPVVFGMFARRLGAQVPGRLVASAKSWLSHTAVDRLAPILPWGAGDDVLKVSPMEASASYLAYLRAAWNWRFPDTLLEEQDIVLTVPASFDEGARALTVEAAKRAGLSQIRLLEEPQAAFYDWLHTHRDKLAAELDKTRLVLICDVGGGTTDLSLIQVAYEGNQLQLTRVGVGKHLMLGGDNMDLVLANLVEKRLTQDQAAAEPAQTGQKRLSATELSQLIERCRNAKEELLALDAPAKTSVTLVGSGSRLIGGTRSTDLTREEVECMIVDGFFPLVSQHDGVVQRRSGIVEFGLPYASDPAITRHLASFLMQHAGRTDGASDHDPQANGASGSLIPDTLLLNGGVFHSRAISSRLEHILGLWRGAPLRVLHNRRPDAAVARGAVAYALAVQGLGTRIGGGSARSYFLVLEPKDNKAQSRSANPDTEAAANPAHAETINAVCIFPRGSEEGKEILLSERVFALRLNQPVRFHLVSSTDDRSKSPPLLGDLLELSTNDVVRLPPIATVLHAKSTDAKQQVTVQLATTLTEVGTLELHCVSTQEPRQRWLLEFQLRADQAGKETDAERRLPERYDQALAALDRIFGSRAQKVEAREVRQLRAQLEKLIGNREQWTMPLLRKLFDELWQRARGRRRSAQHEKAWFNLIGFCLRPGFGYPLDDWRVKQLWSLYEAGAQYGTDNQVAAEWWTMWRRVAGGLEKEAQLRLLDSFAFNVQPDTEEQQERPSQLVRGSMEDMLRLVGSIERIPASYKVEIGDWLFDLLNQSLSASAKSSANEGPILWALARIGARQPFYGNADDVVPPDVAVAWIDSLMRLDWKRVQGAPLTAAHLARATGDRARDLPDEVRDRLVARLQAITAPAAWIAMIHGKVQLDEVSQKGFLGDSLPPGLKLLY